MAAMNSSSRLNTASPSQSIWFDNQAD